eukprot:6795638-Lingulodinium_polyedra.AAC.1
MRSHHAGSDAPASFVFKSFVELHDRLRQFWGRLPWPARAFPLRRPLRRSAHPGLADGRAFIQLEPKRLRMLAMVAVIAMAMVIVPVLKCIMGGDDECPVPVRLCTMLLGMHAQTVCFAVAISLAVAPITKLSC